MFKGKVLAKCKQKKFGEWLLMIKFGDFMDRFEMKKLTKPFAVGGKCCPNDLNELNMGQLIELQSTKDVPSLFEVPAKVILGIDKKKLMSCKATEVVRFSGWVSGEVERINKLFASTNRKPKTEEVQAGIDQLNFGTFGLVDWYAMRMGIKDHEEVMSVPWLRVYKCLQMDTDKAKYEDRLRRVYEDKRRK
jgi:capsid portal protein